jgi:hypothetical protein
VMHAGRPHPTTSSWTTRTGSPRRRRIPILTGALLALTGAGLLAGDARARVNPLSLIEKQIQKPNMLIVFDTSGSMNLLPNAPDMDIHEAGMDCDDGDDYCRTVGKRGRCYMTMSGKNGPGRFNDTTSCTADADCTKAGRCRHDDGLSCTSDAQCEDNTCGWVANNYCVLNDTSVTKIQMCKLGMNMCRNQSDCNKIPGDSCGKATSRLLIAKRVLKQVVQEFHRTVNFGMMTFEQQGYFPYFEAATTPTYETRAAYLSRQELEFSGCFTPAAGPSASCTIAGTVYTLKATGNSKFQLNRGSYSENHTASWAAGCNETCEIVGVGTGVYLGSHYTFPFAQATPGARRTFADYVGRTRVYGGKTYIYLDAPANKRNLNNIYGNELDDTVAYGLDYVNAGQWDGTRVAMMDTSLALPVAGSMAMARQISAMAEKVSMGGIYPFGGTPSGVTLKGTGTAAVKEKSAFHYIQHVKAQNATSGASCRPNAVLFVTDGMPNGTGDDGCDNAQCATSPPGAGCTCAAVLNAYSIRQTLGAKVYVVGFSGTLSSPRDVKSINNIAQAGGTRAGFYATRDTDLYNALTSAIYDSVAGSYATSPVTVGAASRQADDSVATTTVLDSRVDFPSWRGHLISYDVSGGTPVIKWDAARWFDPDDVDAPYAEVTADFWKSRNVWTSEGTAMVKIEVDGAGVITNAARLKGLGLGATDAEAALVARWMLGDPALGNRAVLGAFVNSTPTEVGGPAEPTLTYAGSSDGMLHAFHSRDQTVGGVAYKGGQEAFAYIPQDMLKVIRRLYAQGGQRPSPRDHVFGLANSPKVKKICIAGCTLPTGQSQKTLLVMPEGFGGNEAFTVDISTPFGASGVKRAPGEPPLQLRWHTEHAVPDAVDRSDNNLSLGKTISVPGYYFAKSSGLDDYRLVSASGYTEVANSTAGLEIVTTDGWDGDVLSHVSTVGLGGGCAKPRVDPTEPTILADVAVASRQGASDKARIAAAYVGDTWGNLFRYIPAAGADGNVVTGDPTVTLVESTGCSHPLHFAPTVVQLDMVEAGKHPGAIFLVQVTNSASDPRTSPVSADFPASQLIIRKDLAQAGNAVSADGEWGTGQRIVLHSNNPAHICGVFNAATNSCTTALPGGARPLGTPAAVLRKDGEGFALLTMWYWSDGGGCSRGKTFLTVHMVSADETVKQIHGEEVGSEPVIGAVFAGAKLVVVRQTGPRTVVLGGLNVVPAPASTAAIRYRRTSWSEAP